MSSRLYHEKKWLRQKYKDDKWSQHEIAEFCGVTQSTIYKWMKKFDIKARDASECHIGESNGAWVESPVKSYQWMYEQYIKKQRSIRDLAKEGGVALRTAARWLEKHGIETRKGSDAFIKNREGENNPNYKGGTTCPICGDEKSYSAEKCQECYFDFLKSNSENNPNYKGASTFTQRLRGYTKECWTPQIFERDKYTCVECEDDKGGNLCAHHIIPFSTLRDQIIMDHASDFDLTSEKGINDLLQKAKSDRRINDLQNGVTLCEDCHRGEHRRQRQHKDDLIYTYYADVLEVKDGDSVEVNIDLGFGLRKELEIRLFGVDSPEISSSDIHRRNTAIQAQKAIQSLCIPGRRIIVRTYKPGKYGRWLALLILDGSILNRFLVSSGLANEYYI